MKALIFGANGQDSYYLSKKFLLKGITPIAISRNNLGVRGDVSSFREVQTLVRELRPYYILHLAANSTTNHNSLFENHSTIATGTLNILEAAKRYAPQAKIFITGSGVQFINKNNPISETDPFDANSAYAVARIQSIYAARYYRTLGLRTYVGYLFHHESPLRKAHHISQRIIHLVKRIIAGQYEPMILGDVQVRKEWTFAGDISEGILTLLEQDQVFEATIGSGVAYSIKDWLELSFKKINRDWQNFIILDKEFIPEYKLLVSNPKTINNLGWSPKINIVELNNIMLTDYKD